MSRLGTAFVMTARELLRRRIVLLMLVLVPAVFFAVPDANLRDIQAEMTFAGGKLVWQRMV